MSNLIVKPVLTPLLPTRDPDLDGAGLSDALLAEIKNSSDPRDLVLLGLAEECDRLEMHLKILKKPESILSAVNKRVYALKILNETLIQRDNAVRSQRPVQIMATILRKLKEVLKDDMNLQPEMIESILQNLMHKIQAEEELTGGKKVSS